MRRRLRRAWNFPAGETGDTERPIDAKALRAAALGADPRCAFVARRRRGRVFWGNGQMELVLGQHSAVDEDKTPAIAVLGTMGVGMGYRDQRLYATCALPLSLRDLADGGLGEDRVEHAVAAGGSVTARIERVYAGAVVEQREEVPRGELARQAIAKLFLDKRLFAASLKKTRDRLEAAALLQRVTRSRYVDEGLDMGPWEGEEPVPTLEAWVKERVALLGVETGDDLALLCAEDLLAPDLPEDVRAWLDREFPRELRLGDGAYRILYDLETQEAVLEKVSGRRNTPPSISVLPTLRGFRVKVKHHSRVWVLRERR